MHMEQSIATCTWLTQRKKEREREREREGGGGGVLM